MSINHTPQVPGGWGPRGAALISLDEAWTDIVGQLSADGSEPGAERAESIPVAAARGRILDEAVACRVDYPPFDKAMVDGYAVRAADCASVGAILRVCGEAAAGAPATVAVGPGEAVRINTGAPVPAGADAVVMVEKTTIVSNEAGAGAVRVDAAVAPGQNIDPRGSIRRAGDPAVHRGVRIGAGEIAALCTAGADRVRVRAAPGVAILVTGDELAAPGSTPEAGLIFESNGAMLAAQVASWGGRPHEPVVVPDDDDILCNCLETALAEPVVLIAGGMSLGTRDRVLPALERLGARLRWHGVNMRPGKPAAYARGPRGGHVFGLPGNPVSAFVCAEIFARIAVEALLGLGARPPRFSWARQGQDVPAARDARPAFLPVRLIESASGPPCAEPRPWRGSSDPFGLVEADGLWYRRNPKEPSPAGAEIAVLVLGS